MERLPNYEFKVFLCLHGTGADLEGFEEALTGVDVVIPEFNGWDEESRDLYDRVSFGLVNPEGWAKSRGMLDEEVGDRYSFQIRMLKSLYGKKAAVAFIDPREYRSEAVKMREAAAWPISLVGTKQDVIDDTVRFLANYVEAENKREGVIAQSLPKVLEQLPNSYPGLKKDNVKVLIQFGLGHEKFFRELLEDCSEKEFTVYPDDDPKGNMEEAIEVVKEGREVSNSLALRTAWEARLATIYGPYLVEVSSDSAQKSRFWRELLGELGEKEVWGMIEQERAGTRAMEIVGKEIERNRDRLTLTGVKVDRLLERTYYPYVQDEGRKVWW